MYNIIEEKNLEKNPPKLVIVKWLDHCTTNIVGWQSAHSIVDLEPVIMHTAGWVFKETKDYVIIVPTSSRADSNGMSNICILKTDILKRWDLNDPSTPKPKRKASRKAPRSASKR